MSQAATDSEIEEIVKNYSADAFINILSFEQTEPDAGVFTIQINDDQFLLLESDYIANIEDALRMFSNFGAKKVTLQKVINPPEAFDYEPHLKARPDYFTDAGDDYNRMRLYQTIHSPRKHKKEDWTYFLAKAEKA